MNAQAQVSRNDYIEIQRTLIKRHQKVIDQQRTCMAEKQMPGHRGYIKSLEITIAGCEKRIKAANTLSPETVFMVDMNQLADFTHPA